MAEKAKEAELSSRLEKLPLSDRNEPPLSKAVGSAEKVICLKLDHYERSQEIFHLQTVGHLAVASTIACTNTLTLSQHQLRANMTIFRCFYE